MAIKKISLENFTVFERIEIPFSPGINILIGENGTGKTHVMKVRVFKPDQLKISRLIRRGRGNQRSRIMVESEHARMHVPVLVEMLLELQRNGVQIFISTHDYVFAKYFEVKRKNADNVKYYSFYFSDSGVQVERNEYFSELKENAILRTYDRLLEEVFNHNLGD